MSRPARTPSYDEELALTLAPNTSLQTRYGAVQLNILAGNEVSVIGRVTINNCEHRVAANLRLACSWRNWVLDDQERSSGTTRPAAERRFEIQMWREDRPSERSSDSARRKAAIELERAVSEWGTSRENKPLLLAGAKWSHATRMDAFARQIHDADSEAASSQALAARLREEMTAIAPPDAEQNYSQISLAEAVRHYIGYLNAVLGELYALADNGEPIAPDDLVAALLALERLIRLEHGCATRAHDMQLWDTIEAIREAPRA